VKLKGYIDTVTINCYLRSDGQEIEILKYPKARYYDID